MYSRSVPLLLIAVISLGMAAPVGAQVPARCQIVGTEGDDVLDGTNGDDVICGLGGDDTLRGGGGNDILIGGSGDDSIFGGGGSDELRGGEGDDRVVGGAGNDVVRGGNGDDTLAGGAGHDTLWGGNGDDHLRGAGGSDLLYGGSGRDVVRGGAGSDRLRGGPEVDVCLDSFRLTNALTCEFGNGGESDTILVNQALWATQGDGEFVYSLGLLPSCGPDGVCTDRAGFADVVRVQDGLASARSAGLAFTADELFGHAADGLDAGQDVTFDRAHGLPRMVRLPDGTGLTLTEIVLRDGLRADVERAQRAWREAALTDYSYTVTTECFCVDTEPVRITVVDGVGTSSRDGFGADEEALTIDDHFAEIVALLDGYAIDVRASFDVELGTPRWYSVDVDRRIADDERRVLLDELTFDAPVTQGGAGDEQASDDERTELRIVSVEGIELSSAIATEVQALIDAAALDDLVLRGGGFRDPQRQIDLRRANCGSSDFAIFEMPAEECNPPTARPGSSQHELGLAIDFTSAGRLITSRSDPAFLWLEANAATFGFINLASEPWHWSTTGN